MPKISDETDVFLELYLFVFGVTYLRESVDRLTTCIIADAILSLLIASTNTLTTHLYYDIHFRQRVFQVQPQM